MQSGRVGEVVRWFGLDRCKGQEEIEVELPELRGGEIVLVSGPSGAGKSRLLRRMQEQGQGTRERDSWRCDLLFFA